MYLRPALFLLAVALAGLTGPDAYAAPGDSAQVYPERFQDFDAKTALRYSQDAIGRQLGDYRFTNPQGETVRLSDYRGKPLLINMIFSSCAHTCTISTKHLARMVQVVRAGLGQDSFSVLTVGFDTFRDTPEAMRVYARQQGVSLPDWEFLSADQETIDALSADLGFIYFPSPRGFDHLTQVTVVDHDGVVYRQVYGEIFETPLLGEPLKDLVFNVRSEHSPMESLANRIRLFCTNYDAAGDRYYFDYSLFVGVAVGLSVIGSVIFYLLLEFRHRRPRSG